MWLEYQAVLFVLDSLMSKHVMLNSSKLENSINCLYDDRFGIISDIEKYSLTEYPTTFKHYYAQMCDLKPICGNSNIRIGKGLATNERRAFLKAVGEGVERYCSAYYYKKDLLFCTYDKSTYNLLSPNSFVLYEEDFYNSHPLYSIFTKDSPVYWTKAINLSTNDEVYVPAIMTYFPYICSNTEAKIIQNNTTGLACHDTFENAALGAICEVIERDSVMIFWRNLISPRKIDPSSLPSNIKKIIHKIEGTKYTISLYDITTDTKICTVLSLLDNKFNQSSPIVVAGATNLVAENAVLSAIEELELARLHTENADLNISTINHTEHEVIKIRTFLDHLKFWSNAENKKHLDFIKKSNSVIDFCMLNNYEYSEKDNALSFLTNRLKELSMDVYIADLTTPDIAKFGIHVVRAIVPQAHPFSFGYGFENFRCKRLLTVQESFGLCKKNIGINKIPHPYP